MALVVTNRQVETLEGVTRRDLIKYFGLKTGLCRTGTVTSGSIGSLIDTTQLQSQQLSPAEWTGAWVRISYNASGAGSAPEGEIRTIYEFQPELGKVIVTPDFTVAPAASDTYELWKINPSIVIDVIDMQLRTNLYSPCWSMLTELNDGDMEASGTTYWTGANSTLAKASTGIRLSNSGKQWLTCLSTAANGYAESGTVYVSPSKPLIISALVRSTAASMTAKLQLYDKTNSAEIKSVTSLEQTPVRLYYTAQTPATCYQVSVRLIGVENAASIAWGDVVLLSGSSPDVQLPWWMKKRGQVAGIFNWVPRQSANSTNYAYDPTLTGEVDSKWDIIRSFNGNGFRARARYNGLTYPVFILGRRNDSAYANDTVEKKYIDIETFVACISYALYEYHSQPIVTGLLDASNFKSFLDPLRADWLRLAEENAENINEVIASPEPWGKFQGRYNYGG